jgi:hypothetical protein
MSTSTYVPKHLIYELWLKQYYIDTSSRSVLMCGQESSVFVLPHKLIGNYCRYFLIHSLPKLLEDAPLTVRARMWHMHDCALAHFSCAVRDVLNNTYHARWIGRGGSTAWPPHLLHLNPLDSYVQGHLDTLVCAVPVENEEADHHYTVGACHTIRNYLGTLPDTAVHDKTYQGVHWISWRIFWACMISVFFRL